MVKKPSEKACDALIYAVDTDKDPVVRELAIKALGRYDPNYGGIIPVMRNALNDNDINVRREAALAITSMNPVPTNCLLPLAAKLCDPDTILSNYMRLAFSDMGAAGVMGLIHNLRSYDPELRLVSAEILGKIGRDAQRALPALERLLQDSDARIRVVAMRAIDRIME